MSSEPGQTPAVAVWIKGRGGIHGGVHRVLLAIALAQVTLGIATLLLVVPIPLAVLHQAGAVLLFTAALWALHEAKRA